MKFLTIVSADLEVEMRVCAASGIGGLSELEVLLAEKDAL